MNLFAVRPGVPAHWRADHKAWAERVMRGGRVIVPTMAGFLTPQLSDQMAADVWLPLRNVVTPDDVEPITSTPDCVAVVWPDGTLYYSVPPRSLADLVLIYRHARMVFEHFHGRGRNAPCIAEQARADAGGATIN